MHMYKSSFRLAGRLWPIIILLIPVWSCDLLQQKEDGVLRFHFVRNVQTRSSAMPVDTNDFLLDITAEDGSIVYSGRYGDSPERIMTTPGTYSVKVNSVEFERPAFDFPVYGDRQVAVVRAGQITDVELLCRQVNSGLRLKVDPGFPAAFPDGVLYARSAVGQLAYDYGEKRIGYFNPGDITVVLSDDGEDKVLFTRELEAREILTVGLKVPSSATGGNLSVSVDTTRNWNDEDYELGGEGEAGSSMQTALGVGDARTSAGLKGVWVCGCIAGGDLSSSSEGISFKPPFKSNTHIALSSRTSVTSKAFCLSVELKKGAVRDALNLVDNPQVLGRTVWLKGDLVESYYGIPGLKNVTEYAL